MPSLSDRLKELRKLKGSTQKQMGELLGFTDRYYQKIEYGKVRVNQENLIKLADYFQVSTDYLLGRDNYSTYNKDSPQTVDISGLDNGGAAASKGAD